MLRKAHNKHAPMINWEQVDLKEDVSYDEQTIQIMDRKVYQLRNNEISFVQVRWQFHGEQELTWEREDYMRENFPFLFDL
ncbi:hypothetical protein Sjap_005091 [Stephania japonica]|uniref:Chromo domain-containing protein n=1 Tax=Stephania japonica TaxID=461633 RepID=A0AAP0K4Y1_9MAGN